MAALGLKIEAEKQKHGFVRFRSLDPTQKPEALWRAFPEMMDLLFERATSTQLSGPRPRELDRVTGELAASLHRDDSGLPFGIRGGTDLVFAPVHEFGRTGKLSFLEPALDLALPKFPEILERRMLEVWDASS